MLPSPQKIMNVEEERHQQLMKFMSSLKASIEEKIDNKLDVINGELNRMNVKIDANKDNAEKLRKRTDERLQKLEKEVMRSREGKEKMEERKKRERTKTPQESLEDLMRKKDQQGKQTFERRRITQEELAKVTDEAAEVIEAPIYKSTWASQVEKEELRRSRNSTEAERRCHQEQLEGGTWMEKGRRSAQEKVDEECWEALRPKMITDKKVRKPIVNWFGDDSSEDTNSSDNDTIEEGEEQGKVIQRKEKKLRKKKEQKERKKEKMSEMARKMQQMIGI